MARQRPSVLRPPPPRPWPARRLVLPSAPRLPLPGFPWPAPRCSRRVPRNLFLAVEPGPAQPRGADAGGSLPADVPVVAVAGTAVIGAGARAAVSVAVLAREAGAHDRPPASRSISAASRAAAWGHRPASVSSPASAIADSCDGWM